MALFSPPLHSGIHFGSSSSRRGGASLLLGYIIPTTVALLQGWRRQRMKQTEIRGMKDGGKERVHVMMEEST